MTPLDVISDYPQFRDFCFYRNILGLRLKIQGLGWGFNSEPVENLPDLANLFHLADSGDQVSPIRFIWPNALELYLVVLQLSTVFVIH